MDVAAAIVVTTGVLLLASGVTKAEDPASVVADLVFLFDRIIGEAALRAALRLRSFFFATSSVASLPLSTHGNLASCVAPTCWVYLM